MCYGVFFCLFWAAHLRCKQECFIGLRSGGWQGHFDTTELCLFSVKKPFLDYLKAFSDVHNPAGSNTKPVKYCSTVVIYIYAAAAAEIKSH